MSLFGNRIQECAQQEPLPFLPLASSRFRGRPQVDYLTESSKYHPAMGELSAAPGILSQFYEDEWSSDDDFPSTDDENNVCTSKYVLLDQEKYHVGAEFK